MKRYIAVFAPALMLLAMVGLVPAEAASAAVLSKPATVTPAPRIPAGVRPIGAVSGGTTETGAVVLRPRDEAALTSFIAAVTAPRSGMFHNYLPAGAFASKFGPTAAAIRAVKAQLTGDGLRVTSVARDGLIVDFRGSASTVERAFDTRLERYRLADGSTGQATTSAIRMPAAIARYITAVVGLDNLVRERAVPIFHGSATQANTHTAAVAASFPHPSGSPNACKAAQTAATEFGGLTDDQIAHAYGAFGLYSAGDFGAGQHIAVFELEQFLPSDLQTFDTCYFGATAAGKMLGQLKVIPVDGGQPVGAGSGEAILDVEDVSAIAPRASVDVYEAPNTNFGAIDNYSTIVNDDTDNVVTTSWGECEQLAQQASPGTQQTENELFQQAAAQGQSVFAAAGDDGSDDCNTFGDPFPPAGQNPVSIDDPGSQPYVVSVGGTTIDNATTSPPLEHVWNDGALGGGGGGGISMSWTMPSWQASSLEPGLVLPGSAEYAQANAIEKANGYPAGFCQAYLAGATSSTPCRTVPDVSAQADQFTGAVTIYTVLAGPGDQGWTTIGGTSSSTPIWAALLADINASAPCTANPVTRHGVGFASPLLYAVASSPAAYKASFNDITAGNNDVFGANGGLFPATKGYDLASGLGSPSVTGTGGKAGLAFYLCSYGNTAARPTVTGLGPAVVPAAGGTVTITGSGFMTGSTSLVAAIHVGSGEVSAGNFTVVSNTKITATVPPAIDAVAAQAPAPQDGAGPADVLVTLKSGLSSAPGPASTLQYVDEKSSSPVPSITGLSPYGGLETAPGVVTILGSGFTGATHVEFGGVAASSFKVVSPYEITATPAAYSGSTACAPSVTGESPTTDVCQVQVQVSNAHGSNAPSTILQPYEGALNSAPDGALMVPPGCNCEVAPAPTEFDYVPAPTVTSVSTSAANPSSLASEGGDSLITMTGRGLDFMTLDYLDVGDPSQGSSIDFSEVYETGTQIQFFAPPENVTVDVSTMPLSVRTLGGQSAGIPLTYAGIPLVTRVFNNATKRNAGPDTGGTPMTINGEGFDQAVGPLEFIDSESPFSVGLQSTFTIDSASRISTNTVATNPALLDVSVCTVTGCSYNPPADLFWLYPPGNPRVESISPHQGSHHGGTKVTITGQNLGCVQAVYFGNVKAKKFSNAPALLDCGSTTTVLVTAPPGRPGSRVKVTVITVESKYTGYGRSKSTAYFTYYKKR